MKGKINKNGMMVVTLDPCSEQLDAGGGLHWIPCSKCGTMHKTPKFMSKDLCVSCKAKMKTGCIPFKMSALELIKHMDPKLGELVEPGYTEDALRNIVRANWPFLEEHMK